MPSTPDAFKRAAKRLQDWVAVPEPRQPPPAIVPDDVIDLRDKHRALFDPTLQRDL